MTTENNKIIAEFTGGKEVKKDIIHFPSIVFKEGKNYFSLEELKFHSDWNWLMEVVEKIESLKSDVIIQGNLFGYLCNIRHFKGVTDMEIKFQGHSKTSKFEAVYNACLEFIKWYNEQNRKEN